MPSTQKPTAEGTGRGRTQSEPGLANTMTFSSCQLLAKHGTKFKKKKEKELSFLLENSVDIKSTKKKKKPLFYVKLN